MIIISVYRPITRIPSEVSGAKLTSLADNLTATLVVTCVVW